MVRKVFLLIGILLMILGILLILIGICVANALPLDIDIEGPKVINEGAYFRFKITNHSNYTVVVKMVEPYTTSYLYLEKNETVNLLATAPYINSTQQKIWYNFNITRYEGLTPVLKYRIEYPITVLDSDFLNHYQEIQAKLRLYTTLLIITTAVSVFIIIRFTIEKIVKIAYFSRRKKQQN